MSLVVKCVECPDREFDNPGSARGHANRLQHHIIEVAPALVGKDPSPGQQKAGNAGEAEEADVVNPEPGYPVLTGEMGNDLNSLAEEIRGYWDAGRTQMASVWEARFAIGRALSRARTMLRGDREFGGWVKEQELPFGVATAARFRRLADHEDEVRALLAQADREGKEIPLLKALGTVDPPAPREAPEPLDEEPAHAYSGDAAAILRDFVYSSVTDTVMQMDLSWEGLLDVTEEARADLSKGFKSICERLIEINRIWKENPLD